MKAILEIDLPDNCWDCPIAVQRGDGFLLYCNGIEMDNEDGFGLAVAMYEDNRPPFCPLKIKEG